MKMKKIAAILTAIILVSTITGCAMGNKGTVHYTRTTTIGKELMDLKEAKDKGAMTEQEYNKVKEDIMKCCPIKLECSSGDHDNSCND